MPLVALQVGGVERERPEPASVAVCVNATDADGALLAVAAAMLLGHPAVGCVVSVTATVKTHVLDKPALSVTV